VSLFSDQLDRKFTSRIIFVDIDEEEISNTGILEELLKGKPVPGFRGGMVLRYRGDDSITGLISVRGLCAPKGCDSPTGRPLVRPIDELDIVSCEDRSIKIRDAGAGVLLNPKDDRSWSASKVYQVDYVDDLNQAEIIWSRSNFARFCIELLESLNGTLESEHKRPWFGMIYDSFRTELSPIQPLVPVTGRPHLLVGLHGAKDGASVPLVVDDGRLLSIAFDVVVTNDGDQPAEVSDDQFRTSVVLDPGRSALRQARYLVEDRRSHGASSESILSAGLSFIYRLIYRCPVDRDSLLSVESRIRIEHGTVTLCNHVS
jgi:hypothetical protein